MSKKNKIILTVAIIIVVGLIVYRLISNSMEKIIDGKPYGSYYSSESIVQAKRDKVWIATFSPTRKKYFSSKKNNTYEINEVWVEINKNDAKIHLSESKYENILNVYFKYVTKEDLHEFRLITDAYSRLNQREHPDGHPRVRFLLNEIKDTIKLEVIERNPSDSLAWMTENVIDTIVLIRKN